MVVAPKPSYRRLAGEYLPRHREYTRPRTKVQSREKARYIVGIIMVTLAFIVLLTRFAFIIESQYRLEKMRAEVMRIASENENLKVKIANLKSTERIETIAKTNLKMQEPGEDQIVYIEKR
ncbi:MAG: cell division protein FtsL [Thermosediminibacteraceae bacterium]|nr:cell division protein FtsL [Thermosediminibacteraceae bacterium]